MLTPPVAAILRALIDRIVPEDEFPAASEAGVDQYILRLLKEHTALADTYRTGLEALEAESRVLYTCSFAELDPQKQDHLLILVETGSVTTEWPVGPAAFFQLVVEHTIEGYYSDPGNGGNRNRIAWDMIGFHVRG